MSKLFAPESLIVILVSFLVFKTSSSGSKPILPNLSIVVACSAAGMCLNWLYFGGPSLPFPIFPLLFFFASIAFFASKMTTHSLQVLRTTLSTSISGTAILIVSFSLGLLACFLQQWDQGTYDFIFTYLAVFTLCVGNLPTVVAIESSIKKQNPGVEMIPLRQCRLLHAISTAATPAILLILCYGGKWIPVVAAVAAIIQSLSLIMLVFRFTKCKIISDKNNRLLYPLFSLVLVSVMVCIKTFLGSMHSNSPATTTEYPSMDISSEDSFLTLIQKIYKNSATGQLGNDCSFVFALVDPFVIRVVWCVGAVACAQALSATIILRIRNSLIKSSAQ